MSLFARFKNDNATEYRDNDIVAVANAKVVPTNEVKDAVFAKEILGQTIAFELLDNILVAPCNGTLEVMYPTGHAFGIRMNNGMSILVHVGIDTAKLKGKGFKVYHRQGENVKAGQKLVKINSEWIKEQGFDLTTMLIIAEKIDDEKVLFKFDDIVNRGQIINS